MSLHNNLTIATCRSQDNVFELSSGFAFESLTLATAALSSIKTSIRGDNESQCAVLAARQAYHRLIDAFCAQGTSDTPESRMVLWQTKNAGIKNYLDVLEDAWFHGPTPRSVVSGPISSYNAPGSLVSIELDIRGPHLFTVGSPADFEFLVDQLGLLFEEYDYIDLAVVGISSNEPDTGSSLAMAIALPRSTWQSKNQFPDLIPTLVQHIEDTWRAKCR